MKIAISLDVVFHANKKSFDPEKNYNLRTLAFNTLTRLRKDGHQPAIVTPVNFYDSVRNQLTNKRLQWLPAYVGIALVAGFCRDNQYDILVSSHDPYLKGGDTVGMYTFKFGRDGISDWGRGETKRFSVDSWRGIQMFVDSIEAGNDSYSRKQNKLAEQAVKKETDKLDLINKKIGELLDLIGED